MTAEIRYDVSRIFNVVLFFGILVVLILFCTGCKESGAETITVDDGGGADYTKIQDAINASEDGDTVRVWEGLYEENVEVNKSIDLVGNGSEVTTINGGGSGNVVLITADWVIMSGFGVTGSGQWDAGINVESTSRKLKILLNVQ